MATIANSTIVNPTIVNPTWAGPSLLIPMFPEALLVGAPNLGSTWAATGYQYQNMVVGADPAPQPFQALPAGTGPGLGVNLMWTLPSALRSGQQQGTGGTVDFPLAPNRWLVTRSKAGTGGSPPVLTGWVVQSDYLGTGGANYYPNPDKPDSFTKIGLITPLGSWTGAAPQSGFLTAVAPANLSYAAVFANVGSVFAFSDPLGDGDEGTYAYSILGWYANPDEDPLFGKTAGTPDGFTSQAQWEGILAALGWTTATDVATGEAAWASWLAANPVSGGPGATPAQRADPAQVLCHAMIHGIAWNGTGVAYPTYGSTGGRTPPAVAVGSNGGEALAVWLASTVGTSNTEEMIEKLLLALRNNLALEFATDPAKFETATHAQRFGSGYAGKVWVVQRPTDAQRNPADSLGGNATVPLDPHATELLTQLNAKQAALDALNAVIDSWRQDLFAALWKQQNDAGQTVAIRSQVEKYVERLSDPTTGLIPTGTARAATLQDDIAALQGTLTAALAPPADPGPGAAAAYTLSSIDQPRYMAPVDPVILVAGAGLDTKLSPPGTFDGEDQLPGRYTGQTIRALTVTIAGVAQPVTLAAGDLSPPLGTPADPAVPKEMADFRVEALLLDPGNATWLASLALAKAGVANPTAAQLQSVATDIAARQTAPFAGNSLSVLPGLALAAAAGLTGVPPAAVGVDAWTPPWTPVFMDWQVGWSPTVPSPDAQTPPGDPSDLAGMLGGWTLGRFDYQWDGTAVPAVQDTFMGRTVLTPNQAVALGSQLATFLSAPSNLDMLPDFEVTALQGAQAELSNLDVLTQSLSGLNDQMLMRRSAVIKLDPSPAAALAQTAAGYQPVIDGKSNFYPIRSGHLTLQRLWIVDAFGQILRVIDTEGTIRNIQPLIAHSLATPGKGNEASIQVPPRVTQPVRLDARFLQSDDDAIRSNSSDATSPVCGWVMPNHLDDSLTVFDAAGNNLGALITVRNDNGAAVRWDAVPGTDLPLGSPPQIANAHLAGFVDGILSRRGASQADALAALLDAIDLTLWVTDPLGQPTGGNLAVLVGRPIAVVRVGLTLELDGLPSTAQSWADTGQGNTRGFETVPFPIRVGDFGLDQNGATGYFLGDDYSRFYAANGHDPALCLARRALGRGSGPLPERLAAALSGGATPASGAADDYVVKDATFPVRADGTSTVFLTVLVDPRGSIPVVSGIQPLVTLTLPPGPIASALNAMFVTFRTGPVLTDPDRIGMPLPSAVTGDWSWIERSGVSVWREDDTIATPGQTATLPASPASLREGWLKLSGALGSLKSPVTTGRR
ncbi:hypothetical protein [Methylobacterium indicum]|uniref:Tip attachment protein J domain-containing protein n=1 Tax=Methylobacterium indicum TaxID=1775910 RepID=A0ABR5HG93_9HYPH|nr:hypothetical protein [Methylobacterium indicum]KMO24362.1 hypothetical protein QR78_00845 [Methylobacterium indicum]KMO25275.1 hypothetical protein QR79_08505 [Methylobacterium indicum]